MTYLPLNPQNDAEIKLHEYQIKGIKWLSGKNLALLADEMGLGKSAQAIVAADQVKAKRVLVLCPSVARVNWEREFRKFSKVPRDFYLVTKRNTDPILFNDKSVICSYDLAIHLQVEKMGGFDLLILDEVHFLKSINAKRTNKILGKRGIIRYAKRIWALSGTPAPNHAGELWTILYTFGQVSESYEGFLEKYCHTIDNPHGGKTVVGTKKDRIKELKNILAKIMLKRKTQDVLIELPEITFSDVVVEPGPVDIEVESSFIQYAYPIDRRLELEDELNNQNEMLERMVDDMAAGKDMIKVIEGLSKSVSTLRRYVGLQKVEPIAEMIKKELKANAYGKVVIFAIHRDVIEGLRSKLASFGAVTLYGGTEFHRRQKNIDKFTNYKNCRVFIGNIQACGTAINLISANQVVFAELDWVPGNNMQAAKRCHRIGQKLPVFVRIISLVDSIDEKVNMILRRKIKELTELFDNEAITTLSK